MDAGEAIARNAMNAMTEALALLDSSGAPADIGAHLDLAIERLKAHMLQQGWGPSSEHLQRAS